MKTEFDERITPDETDKGVISIHLKRYDFAKQFCIGKKVLDVACGNGYGAYFLAPFVSEVVGVDISPDAIAYARKRYDHIRASFKRMDACRLEFPDHVFDVVCSFETIEHVARAEDYLSEVARVLKPDGIYVVSTPLVKVTTRQPANPFHHCEWSPSDFKALLLRHFQSIQLFGQRRKESRLHRLLRQLDWFNLRFKLQGRRFKEAVSCATRTTSFSDLELDDMEISEQDFKHADYIIAVTRGTRRSQ